MKVSRNYIFGPPSFRIDRIGPCEILWKNDNNDPSRNLKLSQSHLGWMFMELAEWVLGNSVYTLFALETYQHHKANPKSILLKFWSKIN